MRPLPFAIASLLAVSCANPCRTAQPVVDACLTAKISHPEAYKPIRLEYLGEGRVDRDFYHPEMEEPCGDSTDVRVFRQTFRHLDRSGDPRESVWCIYLTDDLGAVLLAVSSDEPTEEMRWMRRR